MTPVCHVLLNSLRHEDKISTMSTIGMDTHADIAKERGNATFDTEKLTCYLYGSPEKVRRKRYIQNLVVADSFYKQCKPWAFCSREEEYEQALKKHLYANQKTKELGITNPLEVQYYKDCAAPREMDPFGLHVGAFMTTIEAQGTKEQKKKWLPPSANLQVIGTYGQTELGHGTFIRGLETTATYDSSTQEFIINSPKITSMKWWPGQLGKTVNHCVVMAQLYTQGKCFGIHAFIVPLRSLKDHSSLPGVELGDIGPKMGFNGNDNGYLRFHNYRIPRENMLMRYSKVLEDGTYVPPPNSRLSYGSMVMLRAFIVGDCGKALSQACVIAVRYSAVRRQTEAKPGAAELQILDYQTQQYKLLPLVATSYAIHFASREINDIYAKAVKEMEQGNFDELPQLHAISSGMKAFSAWVCSAGVEVCRMACGGHGYSHASGLPKIYSNIAPACTYEGENTILMLQTARFLVKCYAQVMKGKTLSGSVAYLNQDLKKKSCMTKDVALNCLIKAYEHRAARLVKEAALTQYDLIKKGLPTEEARNKSSVLGVRAAKAHCHLFVLQSFVETLNSRQADTNVHKALTSLCRLYGVFGIMENLGEFIMDGFLSGDQVNYVNNCLFEVLADVRRNAVAFVDAFDYPDRILDSCLGRYDGQVYQALYEFAKASPFNDSDVHPAIKKYLQPVIQSTTNATSVAARL